MKSNYSKTHCSHYVLGECSQTHHNKCVGTDKCIKDLEERLKKENGQILEQLQFVRTNNTVLSAELYNLYKTLGEIKQLLSDALDADKTNAEQSFGNFYKAIKLCEVLDE